MRVFLLDLKVLSAITKKEELTNDTYLVSDEEADLIQECMMRNGYFWSDEMGNLKWSPPAPNDYYYTWDDVTKQWVIDVTKHEEYLAEIRSSKWEAIKGIRETKLQDGVECQGKWWHTDIISQTSYSRALEYFTLNPDKTVNWKTMDGSFKVITKDGLTQLLTSIFEASQEIFKVAEIHRAQLNATDSPETYDISINWPKTWTDKAN